MKKDKDRFTIRFNAIDPRQKLTRDVLEAVGRRKASFITDVVCDYLARHENDGLAVYTSLTTTLFSLPDQSHTPGNTIAETRTLENDAPNHTPELTAEINADTATGINEPLDEIPFDEDTCEAVFDALSMFNV